MSDTTDDLIHRLATWAAAAAVERGRDLRSPATAGQIASAESRLGFALHPLLVRLYSEVADGGFGPDGWRLFPIDELQGGHRPEPGETRFWPERVVAVMGVGCGMVSAVDCSDASGQVLLMDPNSFHSNEPEAWSLDARSLAEWLEAWLDGTSWLVEQDAEIDDIAWPVAWTEAAVRLGVGTGAKH